MSDFHKPDEDEDDDGDEEFSEDEEDEEIDLEMIKAKFSSLSSALQETNQNLVTIEMLQDHYRYVYFVNLHNNGESADFEIIQECFQSVGNPQYHFTINRRT